MAAVITTATVDTVSPLKVKTRGAATSHPATSHWSGTALTAGQLVIVLVLDNGATYVQGPA